MKQKGKYEQLYKVLSSRESIKGMYTIHDVEELRENTNVGEYIEFNVHRYVNRFDDGTVVKRVKGTIKDKYPYIFVLENGDVYQWKDYLLGK